MKLEAQADNMRAPRTPAETETIDLTKLFAADFQSQRGMRPHDIGSSFFERLLNGIGPQSGELNPH